MHAEDEKKISLILKHIHPLQDMTIWRTGNVGTREVMLLDDTDINKIWDIFESLYVAYAIEDDSSALLMYDVSENLLPDVREPILREQEELILRKLAQLHAYYWEHDMLSKSWLARQDVFFSFLSPLAPAEEKAAGRKHPLFEVVENGWNVAFGFLPADLKDFILHPPVKKITEGLPQTIIHGDSKLANFAIIPGNKICAFDWAIAASASPGCEIGWYISVNASRLTATKEQVINRYRTFLQTELGFNIENETWDQIMDVAILTGIETLLWNKALNLQKNIPGAKEEWNWWVNRARKTYERSR